MDDETQRENEDGKTREQDETREKLRASHEREIWLRDRFDRERAENLLFLRYLSAQRESGMMRFWRWLIDDLRHERRLDRMAVCPEQPAYHDDPPQSGGRLGFVDRIKSWSARFAGRIKNKSGV